MSESPQILAFAGSTRTGSWNKKMIKIAAQGARDAGAKVTLIDLGDYPMPLYDGDLEANEGIHEHAMQLKALFNAHQGLLIACPEYNSSITAVLKNTIDWVSRSAPDEAPLTAYRHKVVTLMSASPGALGGLRGLVHVRAILSNLGCIVLPQQHALSKAATAFDDDGQLLDKVQQQKVHHLGIQLNEFLQRLQ